ncbi:MAG: response regulator transcription factor [Ruminococcus sp.]|nr:response regulator transcription factor [Ruminococcus sp.]
MRILIIEDEVALADALEQIMQKNKYLTDVCHDGISGLDCAMSGIYDVIILDIMLPKMNGFEVLRSLRIGKISTPVLLLTAKDEIADKVNGLDIGADDYMTKPFNTEELLARIRSLGRRSTGTICENVLSFSDIVLNLSTYELSCKNASLKLGLKEFCILEFFIRNGTAVISKEQLIEKIWGYDSSAEYNNVEVYISFIRKKLIHLNSDVTVKTVRGVGYCLSSGK